MTRFYKKRESLSGWRASVHTNILKIMDKSKEIAKKCAVSRANATMFQIQMGEGRAFIVDLGGKACTCRRFQLTGIPCGHALAAIWFCSHDPVDYVHPWYKKDAFQKCYENTVFPVPSPDNWPKSGANPILPPGANVLPGRPKKKRNRGAEEPPPATASKARRTGSVVHCSNCKQAGHSRRSCKNDAAPIPQSEVIDFILSLS